MTQRGGGRAGKLDVALKRKQARAGAVKLLQHVFPVVGWLKGTRPLGDVAAKWEMLGQFGVILVRMAIETKLTNLDRDTVRAIYMRDNRLFFGLIVQTAVVSFARSALFALTFWMRIRVGIIWR